MVDVYGGRKVVSKYDANVHISYSDNATHIAIDNLISGKQFTVERKNECTEFRATAQIAGLVAFPLDVGPILQTRTEDVRVPVSTQGSFVYAARRLEDGHNDTVYVIDGHNHGPFNGQFKGNACICASGKRTDSSLPFNMAGLCIPPQNPKDVQLDREAYPFSSGATRYGVRRNSRRAAPRIQDIDLTGSKGISLWIGSSFPLNQCSMTIPVVDKTRNI